MTTCSGSTCLLSFWSLLSCSRPDPAPAIEIVTEPEASADIERQDPARKAVREASVGIPAFWRWWATVAPDARLKLAFGEDQSLADVLSDRVSAIHPGLAWEFGPGRTSEHALTLSGEGDPVVRLVAEHWLRAGPGEDATWSYRTTKAAMPREELLGSSVRLDGVDMPLKQVRVVAVRDDTRPRLDVTVWHPAFARMSETSRGMAAFLILDNTLGEDATVRWTDAVDYPTTQPASSMDLLGLVDKVLKLMATTDGTHAVAEGEDPKTGQPLVFTLDTSLARWDHPFHDTWCDVSFSYAADAKGFPAKGELEVLQGLDDELVGILGKDALRAGSVAGAGRRRVWLYLDGDSDAARNVKDWARKQSRNVEVETKFDPGWGELPL